MFCLTLMIRTTLSVLCVGYLLWSVTYCILSFLFLLACLEQCHFTLPLCYVDLLESENELMNIIRLLEK
jgi:hypothetical protein